MCGWDYEEDTLMFANHNRAALFDTPQTDETVKIPLGLYGK